jgi:anti-sigma-K factor RskA
VSTTGAQGRHDDGFLEDAGAYVLGALTQAEHDAFEAHAQGCADCREEVARLQVVADALPLASPQLGASPELKGRIFDAIGDDPARSDAPAQERRTRGAWGGSARRGGPRRWSLVAVPALATLAVVLAVIALAGSGGGGGGARVVRAQVSAPGATASLRIDGGRGQLEISGMPQAPPRHTYEVWVQRAGSPQPTDSLFTVSASGRASVGVPGNLAGATAVLVTAEPLGGSRVPTSAPVLVARVG